MVYRCLLCFLTLVLLTDGFAQQNIRYGTSLKTGSFESSGRGKDKLIILKDSVWYDIIDKDIQILGDSSYLYEKQNKLEVYGRVKVTASDSIHISAKKLIYLLERRMAYFREDVVYHDPDIKLYTDSLDYNLNSGNATYFEGGTIVDDSVTLTSDRGTYNSPVKLSTFLNNVVMISPQYELYSDNLLYDSFSKIARTTTPTRVISEDGIVNATKGLTYNIQNEKSNFRRAVVNTDSYEITGKELFQDKTNEIYKARGNVVMVSDEDELIITGEYADYFKQQDFTIITGMPVMKKIVEEGDTLFMRADTLISIEPDSINEKYLLAYKNVRIFKDGLQGIADSAIYRISDSTMTFYQDPVMWSMDTQLRGDSVLIEIANQSIDKLTTFGKSFVITTDTLNNHNQVKGKEIISNFDGEFITHVEVYGNAESLYYVMEQDSIFMGINKSTSGTMLIKLIENAVHDIIFYQAAEANIIPPHEITDEDKRLEGYTWRIKEKPTRDMVLNFTATIKEEESSVTSTNEQQYPDMKGIIFNK